MFFNFAPTKDRDWILEPGKTYVLKYRMVVFNGKYDAAKAESAWQHFAQQPELKIFIREKKDLFIFWALMCCMESVILAQKRVHIFCPV
ncbi:MAG: DUF6807 family protein [Ginsengibacter sp.]